MENGYEMEPVETCYDEPEQNSGGIGKFVAGAIVGGLSTLGVALVARAKRKRQEQESLNELALELAKLKRKVDTDVSTDVSPKKAENK